MEKPSVQILQNDIKSIKKGSGCLRKAGRHEFMPADLESGGHTEEEV